MKMLFVLLALPIAGFAASAAVAAQPVGDVRTINQLGACMYAFHKDVALELLNTDSASDANRAMARLSDEKTCFARLPNNSLLDTQVANYSTGLMRGMIAEAALRDSPAAAALQPLPLQQKRYVRPWFVATARDPAVDEMSACIADTNPHGILALVSTAPNSAQESWALGDLNASLRQCLARGNQLHADRTALRAALADALYQRVHNPELSVAEVKK